MTVTVLTDQELDRLEALLDDASLEASMRLDEIQGYLCAALCGPRPASREACLTVIFGEGGESGDTPVRREAEVLVGRIVDQLVAQLAAGEHFALWLYPATEAADSPMDYGPWCMAYLHGIDDSLEDWFDGLDEEEAGFIDERLYPMLVLTGEAEAAAREHGEKWPAGEELEELVKECEDALPDAVEDIHRFWLAMRGGPTVRRETPKVGRNDPCPCGSGKKYKQCCGAAA